VIVARLENLEKRGDKQGGTGRTRAGDDDLGAFDRFSETLIFSPSVRQQQIHAQQLPHGAVVGGLPPGGLLGFAGAAAAAAAAGVPPHLAPPPHPAAAAAVQAQAQALLKPADLQQHRAAAETPEDRKPIALPDERLGHRSVSPPEKFRSRTPDLESDPKRRKEEKLGHVSNVLTSPGSHNARACARVLWDRSRGSKRR